MADITIHEVYFSTKHQQIMGHQYAPGDQVPNADALPTLQALIKTGRLRATPAAYMDERHTVADLGSSDETKTKPRKKRKYVRKKSKKAKKAVA